MLSISPLARSIHPRPRRVAPPIGEAGRVLWLAAADGRGHLMRAHLVRAALAERGVVVRVLTTSDEGRAFLGAMGTPAEVLSRSYALRFDDRHNLARSASDACVVRYLASPRRGLRDLARLDAVASDCDLWINDFHPLLVLAPVLAGAGPRPRVVHVYGENLWRALEHDLDGRTPPAVERLWAAGLRALRDRSFGRIEHTLDPSGSPGAATSYRLPPVVAAPERTRDEVRAALGVAPGRKLVAAYLNPYFRDPSIAAAVEEGARSLGAALHAVGEGYADRPGWLRYDRELVNVAAAADLLVSGAGMGAVGAVRHFGVPLVALMGDQPEQRANLRFFGRGEAVEAIDLGTHGDALAEEIGAAARRVLGRAPARRPDPGAVAREVHARWADAVVELVARSRALAARRSA